MNNQKETIGVIISFLLVVGIIGLVIYFLISRKTDEGFTREDLSKNITSEVKDNLKNLQNGQSNTLKEESNLSQKNMNPNKRILNDFSPVAKVDSLKKIDIKEGSGNEVPAGATVSVHYTGALASNGQIFQSSKDFGTEPITFPLGGVIKGWTEGIPGMKVGGVRRLIIPSDMAYGANAPAGSGIPANADLVFDVELIAVK